MVPTVAVVIVPTAPGVDGVPGVAVYANSLPDRSDRATLSRCTVALSTRSWGHRAVLVAPAMVVSMTFITRGRTDGDVLYLGRGGSLPVSLGHTASGRGAFCLLVRRELKVLAHLLVSSSLL